MLIALFITTLISVLFNIFLLVNMRISEEKKNKVISDVLVLQTEMEALIASNSLMYNELDEYKNEIAIQLHSFKQKVEEEKCVSPVE